MLSNGTRRRVLQRCDGLTYSLSIMLCPMSHLFQGVFPSGNVWPITSRSATIVSFLAILSMSHWNHCTSAWHRKLYDDLSTHTFSFPCVPLTYVIVRAMVRSLQLVPLQHTGLSYTILFGCTDTGCITSTLYYQLAQESRTGMWQIRVTS